MDQAERDRWIQEYYSSRFDEAERLVSRSADGRVEFLHVQALVGRRLAAKSWVLNIGGGTGVHRQWLADAEPRSADLSPHLLTIARKPA